MGKIFTFFSGLVFKARIKFKIFFLKTKLGGKLSISMPLYIEPDFSIKGDLSEFKISIGSHCRMRNNFKILAFAGGKLNIGDHNFFNNNCSFNCLSSINIGNNNQFGEGVLFYDHNHNYSEPGKLVSEQGYKLGSIKIGNNCWIGSNVVILNGVQIGDNAVIGAGCILYKSVPPNTRVIAEQNQRYELINRQ